jgi:hypothetical protein
MLSVYIAESLFDKNRTLNPSLEETASLITRIKQGLGKNQVAYPT